MPDEQKRNDAAEACVWGVISQLGLNKVTHQLGMHTQTQLIHVLHDLDYAESIVYQGFEQCTMWSYPTTLGCVPRGLSFRLMRSDTFK